MKSILVVEDDPLSRFMLTEMLEELGYAFLEAENGAQALEMTIRHAGDISVILMDVHMPIRSGLEAMQDIRNHPDDPPRNLPIIAVTADPIWQNRRTARQAGFSHAVAKPISMQALRETIDRHQS